MSRIMKLMGRNFLVFLFYLSTIFFINWEPSYAVSPQLDICIQRENIYKDGYQIPYSIETSKYHTVRNVLSTTDSINNLANLIKIPLPQLELATQITKAASNATKIVIYIEDWVHTDKEIEHRINDILNSINLSNSADDIKLQDDFKKYVKISLQRWIPDRDYPKIGYLPKELLYDQCLGEKEITKYWPEASKSDQEKYVALTFDELIWNYELLLHDLQKGNKTIP